ncbi:MAG: GNAT family N-acetyltransferase [Nocardioidaceae bacterium]
MSVVSTESYSNVMATWPYRYGLDWVVESPDGQLVAFCLGWLDEHNQVGELEPVGTDPVFRGLGLGRAVSLAALHALRDAGADIAVVYPRGDATYPVAASLYRSIGFTPGARTITYTR